MIRRNLLVAVALIATVVLSAACSDATGPQNVCPVSSGSGICTT